MISIEYLSNEYPVVFSTINKFYYALGLGVDIFPKPRLKNLIHDRIVIRENYLTSWEEGFCHSLQSKMEHDIIGLTNGLVPNYGGKFILEELDSKISELHFYVSLLDNFFTVFVLTVDKIKNLNKGLDINYLHRNNELVVSPTEGYFKEEFLIVENAIRDWYDSSKMIPFSLKNRRIKGLRVNYSEDNDCTLGQAFFCEVMALNKPETVIGDLDYGLKDIKNL